MRHRLAALVPIYLVTYAVCYYVSYLLRFDFDLPARHASAFANSILMLLAIKVVSALLSGEWRRTFLYSSMADLFYLMGGAVGAAAVLYAANVFFFNGAIPRTVILIDGMLTILMIGTLRSGARVYVETIQPVLSHQAKERTLIYSSDRTAVSILRTLQACGSEYRVIGFVDDSRLHSNKMIAGRRVFSLKLGWRWFARKLRAKHVLIPSTLPGKTVREIVRHCADVGLKAAVIPSVHEIVDGRYTLSVREVTISDLLRREPTRLDMESIAKYIAGRRVLVTGAAGSIGSELCRQVLSHNPASLVFLDQSEFGIFTIQQEVLQTNPDATLHFSLVDITDENALARVMMEYRPELLFHAAAYKHVPLMEENPQAAIHNNVLGTKNVIDAADRFGVERFVLISTDKAVRPSSIMGASKLIAEKYAQAISTTSSMRLITVRFGNVLNSAGSVVPIFRRQIEAGGPVRVTHPDMERFFMTIPEAVQLVLQAGAIGHSGDVLILEMGEPVKILDLAKDMILLSGLRYPEDIDITFTGVRPGEKLAEELFYLNEHGAKRVHEKIFCGTGERPSLEDVQTQISSLAAALNSSRADAAATLSEVVAHFVGAEEQSIQIDRAAA